MDYARDIVGEARQKQETHRALLERYPVCIYCAGPADTIEHMPPIMLFKGKRRPNQLYFPACEECNNGTGQADVVASLFARIYPEMADDEDRAEVAKLLRANSNNVRGLLQEMKMGRGAQKLARKEIPVTATDIGVLRADGLILNHHIRVFAAKLGFALYFEVTGKALSTKGAVRPIWFSNVQALRNEIPNDFVRALPAPETLRQGKLHVRERFEYSRRIEDGVGGYLARFGFGFFAGGLISEDSSVLGGGSEQWPIFRSGAFQNSG